MTGAKRPQGVIRARIHAAGADWITGLGLTNESVSFIKLCILGGLYLVCHLLDRNERPKHYLLSIFGFDLIFQLYS